MILFEMKDNLNVHVNTDNWDYLRALKEEFSEYVEGFQYMPSYKTGQWNGKISLFDSMNRTFPYGMFLDVLKYHKKEWSDTEYTIDESVKQVFKGGDFEIKPDLLFPPYDYQEDCISACLKWSKGIIRSATASGKSLMISYVLKTLFENNAISKAIIIVPSIGLVTQFYTDMEEYGIDMSMVGRVGDKLKQWDYPLTISTWQSLQNCPEKMEQYDAVIVDEVHGAKADVLQNLLSRCDNAVWRFGFTGTMPDPKLEHYQVQSYLGPVLKEYGSVELAKLGYVAECKIKMVHLEYENEPKGTYDDVKNEVFRNGYRLSLIEEIIRSVDGSILLLVGKVKDEGDFLIEHLENKFEDDDREVMFLSGRDSATEREKWRKYADKKTNVVLIATYGIFQQGINIKSLKYLILAAPFKSKIRVLQSIGRTLRLHADKKQGALIWDICDGTKHQRKHSDIRLKHYNKEGFDIEDIYIYEGDRIEESLFT